MSDKEIVPVRLPDIRDVVQVSIDRAIELEKALRELVYETENLATPLKSLLPETNFKQLGEALTKAKELLGEK